MVCGRLCYDKMKLLGRCQTFFYHFLDVSGHTVASKIGTTTGTTCEAAANLFQRQRHPRGFARASLGHWAAQAESSRAADGG